MIKTLVMLLLVVLTLVTLIGCSPTDYNTETVYTTAPIYSWNGTDWRDITTPYSFNATGYISHSLATATNDFLVASGAGTFVKKTLVEILTILGKGAASGLASLNASAKVVEQSASISDHLDNTAGGTNEVVTKAPTSDVMYEHTSAIIAHGTSSAIAEITDIPSQGARVTHDANQNTSSGALTLLALNLEQYDTDTIHSTTVNNSRLTCKTAGKYIITGNIRWPANATGTRQLSIILNGATYIASVYVASISDSVLYQSVTTIYDLAINDYIELAAAQDSGSTLAINTLGYISPIFVMQRVG